MTQMRPIYFVILGAALITLIFLVQIDFLEFFYEYSRSHEAYELDEIFSVFVVSSIGLLLALVIMNRDFRREIARRKKAELEAERSARRDPLTGLANRRVFVAELEAHLARARAADERLAVLLLDLDHFKRINDVYGYDSGDEVLQLVAERLTKVVGQSSFLSRLTGDDYAILADAVDDEEALFRLSQRILTAVGAPFARKGLPNEVTGSIGIAVFPTDGDDPDTILRQANHALGQAKMSGRNTYMLFDPALDRLLQNRRALEKALRKAIDTDEIVPNFQPIYNLQTMQPVAVETFVRWDHPEKGMLAAEEFLGIAEDAQLIGDLFFVVLDKVCAEMRRWPKSVSASLNISTQQFADPDLAGKVLAALEKNGLPTDVFEIEVPEASIVSDMTRTLATLRRLKAGGVRISLDHFGTGFSSLRQLRELPIDKVKIDGTFVNRVDTDVEARRVVASIIDLGHALGFAASASGIERAGQAVWVRERGCEFGQGNLFCEPLEASALAELLAETRRLSVP